MTYLLFAEVVGEIGDHDLVLRRDSVFRRTTLPGLARLARLVLLVGSSGSSCGRGISLLNILNVCCLGSSVREWKNTRIGDTIGLSSGLFLLVSMRQRLNFVIF